MSNTYIIGIAGFKRSGKDTLARTISELAQARGFAVATIAFADPLRQAASAAYGINAAEFTDDALKDRIVAAWGITRRQMLINLGEAMRSVDPDHWIKAWRRAIATRSNITRETWPKSPILVITPDLRRVNEAQAIHAAGGINVLLRRDGVTWDGHINEALAEVAQRRDDALAVQIGAEYLASNVLSVASSGCVLKRRIFDCDAHNPVSARQTGPVDDVQRRELDALAAAILDRVVRS